MNSASKTPLNKRRFARKQANTLLLIKVAVLMVSAAALVMHVCDPSDSTALFAAVSSVTLSLYLLFHCRKNWALSIVFAYVALCVYSSFVVNYFDVSLASPYLQWKHSAVSFESVTVFLVFLFCIVVVMPLDIRRFPLDDVLVAENRKNLTVAVFCGIAALACGIIGIGEATGAGSRVSVSSIYEYSIVFFIVGLFFSGKNKYVLAFLGSVLAFRVVLDVTLGTRVTSVELICIWFLMVYASKARWSRLLPLGVLLFVLMLTVGELRGSTFDVSAIVEGISDFVNAGFAWDGAYAAYHTSQSFVAYSDFMPQDGRFQEFIRFAASMLLGDSVGLSNLAHEVGNVFWNMGGGYYPYFFYYYLGMPGVIVFSLAMGFMLRAIAKLSNSDSLTNVALVCIVWISVTVFRWFSYAPTPLVRGLLVLIIVYAIAASFASRRTTANPKLKKAVS